MIEKPHPPPCNKSAPKEKAPKDTASQENAPNNALRQRLLGSGSSCASSSIHHDGSYCAGSIHSKNQINGQPKRKSKNKLRHQSNGSPCFWAKCVRSVTLLAALNAQMAPVFAGKVELYHIDHIAGGQFPSGTNIGDGGPATSAALSNPSSLAVDGANNLYLRDSYANGVRFIPSSNTSLFGSSQTAGNIYTIAGNGGTSTSIVNNSLATNVSLDAPRGIAADASGNVYITDITYYNIYSNYYRSYAHGNQGRVLFVAATSGTYFGQSCTAGYIYNIEGGNNDGLGSYGDGGQASSAFILNPQGVAVDSHSNVFITDNQKIRFVANQSGTYFGQSCAVGNIYRIAGNASGSAGYYGDGGPATSALLSNNVQYIATDRAGNVYISDAGNNVIRFVANQSGTYFGQSCAVGNIYTIAGCGSAGYSGDGGPATSATLSDLTGVAVDAQGNLYIDDSTNRIIRFVPAQSFGSTTAGSIYTIAGIYYGSDQHTSWVGSGDGGPALSARLGTPAGIAVDGLGNVYLHLPNNSTIRKVTPNYIGSSASDTALTNTDYGLFEAINLAGGTLVAGASGDGSGLTISNPIYLTPNTTSIIDTTSYPLTLTGAITGTGFLNHIGSNSLTLTGDVNPLSIGGSNINLQSSSLILSTPIVIDTHNTYINLSLCTIEGSYPIAVIGSGTVNFQSNYSGTVICANDGLTKVQFGGVTDSNKATIDQSPSHIDINHPSLCSLYFGYSGTASPDSSTPLSSGSLIMSGSGKTLTLTNANTYPGLSILQDGKVNIGNNQALSSNTVYFYAKSGGNPILQAGRASLTVANPMLLVTDGRVDVNGKMLTLNGAISGISGLKIEDTSGTGSGVVVLAGRNTYLGSTTISSATLEIASSIDNTSQIINNGSLVFAQTANDTYANIISGSGSLTQNGIATLTLSNYFTNYSGGTTLNSGILSFSGTTSRAGDCGPLGSGPITLNGGILQAGVSSAKISGQNIVFSVPAIIDTNGSNTFDLSAAKFMSASNPSKCIAVIGGGTVKFPSSACYLTYANDGTTNIQLGSSPLGSSNTIDQSPSSSSSGSIYYYIGYSGTAHPDSSTALSSGSLIMSGSGKTLTLTNANTYPGTSILQDGIVNIGNNQALSSNTVYFYAKSGGNPILQAGSASLTVANPLFLVTNGTVDVNGKMLTLNGAISGISGLTVKDTSGTGSGVVVLAGSNTYLGATTISSATLEIAGSIDSSSQIINNAGLVFAQTANDTYAHTISGSGSLTQNGSATLTLAGSNTYTGPTTINSGALQVTGSIDSSSHIVNNGNLIFAQSADETDFHVISGTGSLTIAGLHTLTLAGSNTYTGGTTVNSGTLSISDPSNIGSGALTLAGGTLQAGADLTLNQALILTADSILDPNGHNVILQGLITPNGHTLTILSGSATYSPGGSGSYPLTGIVTFILTLSSASLSYRLTAESSTSVKLSPVTNLFGTPASYVIFSGTLPSGLSLASTTGVISGTPAPSSTGTYHLAYSVANQHGSATLTINAPTISLPAGNTVTEYNTAITNQTFPTASGGSTTIDNTFGISGNASSCTLTHGILSISGATLSYYPTPEALPPDPG